jgi:thiamine monophosphate kinase
LVLTAAPEHEAAIHREARLAGVPLTVIGRVGDGAGVQVLIDGEARRSDRAGWRHR